MSEDKKYTLTEYVFRDIRFGNEYPPVAVKVNGSLEKNKDSISLVDDYQRLMRKTYKWSKPDAERWQFALESYLLYPCFSEFEGYEIKKRTETNSEERYFLNYSGIWITADLLTGPTFIVKSARKLIKNNPQRTDELNEALRLFCSVVYTVGNCCPTMKNPGAGGDASWYKLGNFHSVEENDSLPSICDGNWSDNCNDRDAANMFAVFPKRLSGREIVDRLMLKDYYDDDYNLIITDTPAQRASKGVDEYIDFLRLVTTLIIKRGIRIYYKSKVDNLNLDKLAEELINEKKKELQNSAHA